MSLDFLHIPDKVFTGAVGLFAVLLIWLFVRGWKYRQIKPIVIFRTGLILLLLFTLLSPKFTRKVVSREDLPVGIFIDNSLSVGYHQDHSLGTLNSGLWEFRKELERREIPYNYYFFSDSVRQVTNGENLSGTGQMTDLGNVIQDILDNQDRLSAAVMITDGQVTQGAGPQILMNKISIPVHTIGLGNETPLVDIAINSIDVPTVSVKGEEVEAVVQVSSTGTTQERLNVSLYSGNKMIGSRFVTVYGGESFSEVRFRFKQENLGDVKYRVQVSSLSDEINIQNNRQSFNIMVLKDEYRVALISGTPGFNTQTIKAIFSAQPRVNVDHYISDPKRDVRNLKGFWETPYELIILDNFPSVELPVSWQKVFARKLIAQKSALLWIAGPNQTSDNAKSIFPFFHVQSPAQLLEKNEKYSWYFNKNEIERILPGLRPNISHFVSNDYPPVRTGIELESNQPEYSVISTISTGNVSVPVLLLGEKESLRYGIWSSPDFSTLFYQLKDSDKSLLLPELIGNVGRWLMRTDGEKDMYFSLNKNSFQRGEQILIYGNQTARTDAYSTGSVIVTKEGSSVLNTPLRFNSAKDRWEGKFWASAPGKYKYEVSIENNGVLTTQDGGFIVEESQVELNKVFLNSDLLNLISSASNAVYKPWASRADIFNHISRSESSEYLIKETVLIENRIWLLLLLVWFSIELGWRRFIGLS